MLPEPFSFMNPALDTAFSLVRAFVRASAGVVTQERVIAGVQWSWLEAGPRDGEPLVLLHGFSGSKDNWILIAPLLARRYRVICPDLPGFGESGLTAKGDYAIGKQAERVIAFIDALGLAPCHLGGNSMGGFIALAVALDAPEKVASLVLLNNAGVDGVELTPAQQALKAGEDLFEVHGADDVNALLDILMHRPPYLPWLVRRTIAAHLAKRRVLEHHILAQILVDAIERPFNDRLGEVKAPSLIMWGRSDQLLHPSAADTQHAGIADAELVILDNAGHVPMIERPFRTAREMLSFLSRRGSIPG
jgi:abhydrolase domain-containing protein 6